MIRETETPYYYTARFEPSLICTEFSPAARCGYYRFTFPSGKPVVLLANRRDGELTANPDGSVSGFERFRGESRMSSGEMQAFVYGEFSAPVKIEKSGGEKGSRLGITAAGAGDVLEFRYGISFISVEQAKANLRKEIPSWNFDGTKDAARARWNDVLRQIQVAGGTAGTKARFLHIALPLL